MTIPDYETLMLPILKLFGDGAANVAEVVPKLKEKYNISDEEAEELLPSGRVTVLQSRAHWARTYLSKAGLLNSPKRNLHVITQRGREVLASNPEGLDNKYLDRFTEFVDWRTNSVGRDKDSSDTYGPAKINDNQTPEDAMETASNLLRSAMRDELLALLLELTPQRFERVIMDLLAAMGFGGGDLENSHHTNTTSQQR